jgi:tetratricopeptide (TPR) repeat protein
MRGTTRTALLLAIALGLVVGVAFGGVLGESPSAAAPRASEVLAAPTEIALGVTGRDTAGTIMRLEAVASTDATPEVLANLGLGYQLRWRETADASFLPRSEAALRKARALRRDDPAAALGLGSLALIRHDFRGALRLGREARALAPDSSAPYGVVGDALLELGRYDEAFATFEQMVATKPTLAGYARIAYARELTGDRDGAIAAMRLALESAGGVPEPTAWTLVELAKLEFGSGRVQRAEAALSDALRVLPGYAPAGDLRARVLVAQGRVDAATAQARRTAEAIPLPGSIALLGELLERRGQLGEARRQYETVAAIHRLLADSGIQVDLDEAVYRADRGIEPARTVELARRARADRPSIAGDDALGWALARAGRCEAAEPWLEKALRLGTKDAFLYFHRGYAAGCAGDRAAMRTWYGKALALNPHFSVQWAPVAREAIA